jgi:hypothetical protein
MKNFLFIAIPKWGTKTKRLSQYTTTAPSLYEARAKARLEWAKQGRLPNNVTIIEY